MKIYKEISNCSLVENKLVKLMVVNFLSIITVLYTSIKVNKGARHAYGMIYEALENVFC